MATPKKSRKKTPKVQVEHPLFGPCLLVERRTTPTGNEVFLAEFADKTTRTLLASAKFWVTLPDLAAIPVAKKTAVAVKLDREPEIDVEVDGEADVELECVA
jgi:hypothetical protein